MQNNGQYFALIPQSNGTIKRTYPKQIWLSHYCGLEMFVYRASFEEWRVIEKNTGLPVATSRESRNNAFARSREVIDKKGVDKILEEAMIACKALDTINIYEEIE
jgi:hypothetical protein